jgi:hypothetical protein
MQVYKWNLDVNKQCDYTVLCITGFQIFFSFCHKKEPPLYKYLDDITKSGTADELHSIKMPESPDIEDYIYMGYALLQNRKKDWQVRVTVPEAK